ncbi:malonate--CoA ligase [Pseudooceanicola sp. 502str34]
MTNILFDGLFAAHADATTPFLHLPGGEVRTHADVLRAAARYANAIAALGAQPGDRVALQVEKSPEALEVYAACVMGGFVFLPLNTAYTAAEISYFVADCAPHLLICDPARRETLATALSETDIRLETLDASGQGSLSDLAAAAPETFTPAERGTDDLAALLYTSGTTGRSKGAMLSHGNLLSNAETLTRLWRFTGEDRLLHALPIFHSHGLFVATNVILKAGAAIEFLPGFDRDAVIEALPRCTAMMGVPTFYTRLLGDPRFTRDLASHMRLFISGSAPLLAETHDAFSERTGHRILERYGLTETSMNTSNPYDGERRPGTVGFALPGVDLKITDPESGATLEQGAIGMIEVRGPNVFKGYWNMPEKTAEELRADGFFITGDLGRIDEAGYVHIVGRQKDLIISGGYNIYPKEIETLLDGLPGVLESAVVGVPNADFGESVLALIVAKDGCQPDVDLLTHSVAANLARFKHPRRIVVVDELPRNTMGKVQKNILRDTYKTALDA